MNPLSLLTKGRTIRGFKDRSCVYRLTLIGAAPNFSTGRNKSPISAHPEPQVSQSTLFDQPQPPATAPAPVPAPRSPAQAPQPVSRTTAWSRLTLFCAELLQRWTASSKASPFHGRTVQTELVLEKVKVKRNDLSEDDLEVVPVGKKEKPAQHDQCQAISTDR
jgi:hypothetical protein